MKPIGLGLLSLSLVLASGCGGSSSNAKTIATNLAYTNPTDTTAWRLVADPASTASHLILDLLAPAGATGQGLTLVLSTGTAATWSRTSGAYASAVIYPSPVVNLASVKGADLRMLIAQAPGLPTVYGTTPVLAVALDLAANVPLGTIALSASQGGHLGTTPQPLAIVVAVGSLQAE